MPLLGQENRRLWRNTTAPQAENFGPSSSRYDLQLDSTYARAAVISGCRRPRWRRALLDAVLLPRALLRFALSLCADLRESLSTRERQSKSVALRLARGTHESAIMLRKSFLWFLLKTFFSPCPFPAPQALKNMAPPIRAEVLRVLYWDPHFRQGAGRHLPPRRGSAAGTLCAPQAENFSRWGRRGSIWGSERGSGPKNGI